MEVAAEPGSFPLLGRGARSETGTRPSGFFAKVGALVPLSPLYSVVPVPKALYNTPKATQTMSTPPITIITPLHLLSSLIHAKTSVGDR